MDGWRHFVCVEPVTDCGQTENVVGSDVHLEIPHLDGGIAHTRIHERTDMTEITLGLKADDETRQLWPHDFDLELKVSVSMKLNLKLTTKMSRIPASFFFGISIVLCLIFAHVLPSGFKLAWGSWLYMLAGVIGIAVCNIEKLTNN